MTTDTTPAAPVDQAPPADQEKPEPKKLTNSERAKLYREKKKVESSAKGSPVQKPKRGRPKGSQSNKSANIFAVKICFLVIAYLARFPQAARLEHWIGAPASFDEIKERPGFALGWLRALIAILSTCSRITPHEAMLRRLLEGLRIHWRETMTATELGILESMPEVVVLWRSAGAQNRVGLTWCNTREAAIAYSKLPPFRLREPVLLEAVIDRARIVTVRETIGGFECLALSEPGDLVGEVKL